MNSKKQRKEDQPTPFTQAEEVEAKRLVKELAGNSHNPDRIYAIMNRHRDQLGIRFVRITTIALIFMTTDILEGMVKVVDRINPDCRDRLQGWATESEFQSPTDTL